MNSLYKTTTHLFAFASVCTGLIADQTLSDEAFFEEDLEGVIEVSDPIEPVNRVIFKFNDIFITKLLSPVSKGYKAVTTPTIRQGAHNVFYNLRYPIRLSGNLLQGRLMALGRRPVALR